MGAIVLLAGIVMVALVARALVRKLGFPTNLDSALKWGVLLLGIALLTSIAPSFCQAFRTRAAAIDAELPTGALVGLLVYGGLAVVGWLGWRRAAEAREERARRAARVRELPRHRALPPAPGRDDEQPPTGA